MAAKEYTRVGNRGRRAKEFFTWSSLWMGADHLLQIEHTGYAEEYKRFYFRDIQSITVRRNNRALAWSIFFSVMIGIGVAMLWTSEDFGAWLFSILFIAFWGILLVINLVKGPSCISHIKTAVQQDELPAFRRVKKTEKSMARIREMIAAAQGDWSVEEIRNRIAAGRPVSAVSAGTPTAPPHAPPEPPPLP